MAFELVLLEDEQKELFCRIVEMSRSVPRPKRQKFYLVKSMSGTWLDYPPTDEMITVLESDVDSLVEIQVLRETFDSRGNRMVDVTPYGAEYYAYLRSARSEALETVASELLLFIQADDFRKRYPKALGTWERACAQLWKADAEDAYTEIGHACREALQHFASTLVEFHKPETVSSDPAHTVARVRAVLEKTKARRGERHHAFLDAVLAYWGTVSDLVQRQEHGAQKEGYQLVWEDARRVVFNTALVMYEIDRATG